MFCPLWYKRIEFGNARGRAAGMPEPCVPGMIGCGGATNDDTASIRGWARGSIVPANHGRACQILRISGRSRSATAVTYVQRVNLAIDHIVGHLDEPLRLRELARVALLSPFHFHRVFQALIGATPADFVQRLRLEKALGILAHPRPPSLTAIALACGFSSSSVFCRCFKRRFGVPPSSFDVAAWRGAHRAELEAIVEQAAPRPHVERLPPRHNPDGFRVRIRALPARTVAYIRVDRPYQGNNAMKAVW